MRKTVLATILMAAITTSFHMSHADQKADRAKAIEQEVSLVNEEFARLIIENLNVAPVRVNRVGGRSLVYSVDPGLSCSINQATRGPTVVATSYHCTLLPSGGWRELGSSSYGSGSNEAFSQKLYAALKVASNHDQDFSAKVIELNVPDPNGGTQRNQLVCMVPTKSGNRYLRPNCQVVNAL